MSNQKQPVASPVLNKDYQLLLDRLLKLMREQMDERLLAVCLYGSLARGQVHRGSDVDLFIVIQGEREETGKIWVAAHQALVATPEYEALVQQGIWPDLSPFIVTQAFLAAETPWLLLEVQDHGIIPCGDECQVHCRTCGGRGPVAQSASAAIELWRKRS